MTLIARDTVLSGRPAVFGDVRFPWGMQDTSYPTVPCAQMAQTLARSMHEPQRASRERGYLAVGLRGG